MAAQRVNLNMVPNNSLPQIHLSQGDIGRQFVLNLVDSSTGYEIPAGATVTVRGTKPSGMGYTVTGTVNESAVTVVTTADMTDEFGMVASEVVITSGGTVIGSTNFALAIEMDPHPAGTIDGRQESLIPELTLLVERVEAAAASVHDLSVSATTLAPGSAATATYDDETNQISFGIPRGADGVDGEVTQAQLDAAVTDLKSDFEEIAELIEPTNLLNFDDENFETGKYMAQNGTKYTSATYNLSGYIPVEVGKTYIFTYGNTIGTARSMRFLCAFDASKSVKGSDGGENLYSYTVPEGVTFIRFSAEAVYFNSETSNIMFGESPITEYEEYFAPYWEVKNSALDADYLNGLINAKIVDVVTDYGLATTATADSMSSADTLTAVQNIDNKTNAVIEFIGYFDSFTSLVVGHGFEINYGNKAVIDDTNLTVYYGANNQQMSQVAHGLTISDFIHVVITQNNGARAKIQIITASGYYTLSDCSWDGCRGNVFAKVGATTTDCVLTAVFKNLNEKLFLFGDSYVSMGDPARFPYYLIQDGYTHLLIDGWGGRNSENALISFNNVIAKAVPKYAVWDLGMNDNDGADAVNASWLSCVREFISTCETNGITPILCTIPNCPNQRNSYKNAWVKASGKRYVDFAKAVGAEEAGSSWYGGMLSTDNVHPTSLGAKVLYARFLTDVPEVIR